MSLTDRQLVARVLGRSLTKPARDLSDAYVRRLARGIREARAAGERPSRQTIRGHRPRIVTVGGERVAVTTEHPKSYIRRGGERVYVHERGGELRDRRGKGVRPAPIRRGADDRHVAGHAVLAERTYQSPSAAYRFLRSHPAGTGVQAIAYGVLQPEWIVRTGSGIPPRPDVDDEDDEPEDQEGWRPFYTGTADGAPDLNGASAETYAEFTAARDDVFVPGTVETYLIRWQA